MPTRVLHISDIHTGTAVESRLDEVLPPIVEELDPELVLFTGDLTHRLVIPALYNVAATGLLPDKFGVVGIARNGMSNDDLRDSLMQGLRRRHRHQAFGIRAPEKNGDPRHLGSIPIRLMSQCSSVPEFSLTRARPVSPSASIS